MAITTNVPPGGAVIDQNNGLPTAPLTGTDNGGPGVTGQSNVGAGVYGESLGFVVTGVAIPGLKPASDGVLGKGANGVHGISGTGSGVLGENSGSGCGVTGTSAAGDGVYGMNEATSGTTSQYGCGVRGESKQGYGVYGASANRSGIYGTSGTGLAGEFLGNVSITGDVTVSGHFSSINATALHGINGTGSGTSAKFGCGVWGESDQGYGVYAASKSASALYATSSSGLAGEFNGNVTVSGNLTAADVILSGADCAEEFDIAGPTLEPGTVTVFDQSGSLGACATPYDKRVAGVISGAGEFRPGVILDRRISSRNRAPIALAGKVYCKVDASFAAIEVGDLLTTSPTTGCAMKAADPMQSFGTIIGKALAPIDAGRGLIPILVMSR